MDDPEDICRKLKPVIGSKADALWKIYLTEDFKGRKEIESLLQILQFKYLKKDLNNESIFLVPPDRDSAKGKFPIGRVVYNNKETCEIGLNEEDFQKQIGIFAITGEGKSNVGMLLALNLLKNKTPFVIVDWKRAYRNLLSLSQKTFPELKDLQIFTVGRKSVPFYWNPFRPPPNIHWKTWISVIAEALEKSHLSGPGVADYFIRIYERKFEEMQDDRYPNFFDGLYEIDKFRAIGRELLWRQSARRILKNFTFGPHSESFNAREPIKLEELLDNPVILELDLEIPKPQRTFFTEMILRFIHLYRLSQMETDRLRHVLFLEECQNLFPRTREERESSGSLENIYREIRSFGQGIVSITQHTSLLPVYILGNCHTQITLGLQHGDDITASKKSLFLKHGEETYLDKLKVGEGIVKIRGRISPCHVKFPLVPVRKGKINDGFIKKHMRGYSGYSIKLSDGTNGLKGGIPPLRNISSGTGGIPSDDEKRFLVDVLEFPFAGVIERYKRLGFSMRKGDEIKNILIKKEFLKGNKIITKKGWIVVLQLLREGIKFLRNQDYEVLDYRNGIEHRFWKHKIAEYYRKRGFNVAVEQNVNGNADIIVKKGKKITAIEIETEKYRAVRNVLKNLKHRCHFIISVAVNDSVASAIKAELKKANLHDSKRIIVTTVSSYY